MDLQQRPKLPKDNHFCENYDTKVSSGLPSPTTAEGKTTWHLPLRGSRRKSELLCKGPGNYNDYNDNSKREQEKDTTGDWGDYHDRSHDYSHYDMSLCVWDKDHHYIEDNRLTTTGEMIGLGEGTTTTTRTRMTAMTAITQDQLLERNSKKKTTTSFDLVHRLLIHSLATL